MARQEEQQVELTLGERQLRAVAGGAAAGAVDRQAVRELQRRLVAGGGLDAAQDGVHAGHELRGGEGLDHVVVGAEAQPDDPVGFLAPGRQQDDRQPVGVGIAQGASPPGRRCRAA